MVSTRRRNSVNTRAAAAGKQKEKVDASLNQQDIQKITKKPGRPPKSTGKLPNTNGTKSTDATLHESNSKQSTNTNKNGGKTQEGDVLVDVCSKNLTRRRKLPEQPQEREYKKSLEEHEAQKSAIGKRKGGRPTQAQKSAPKKKNTGSTNATRSSVSDYGSSDDDMEETVKDEGTSLFAGRAQDIARAKKSLVQAIERNNAICIPKPKTTHLHAPYKVKGYKQSMFTSFKKILAKIMRQSEHQIDKELEKNDQYYKIGGKIDKGVALTDGRLQGAIPRCPSCKIGTPTYDYFNDTYFCKGYINEQKYKSVHCGEVFNKMDRKKPQEWEEEIDLDVIESDKE